MHFACLVVGDNPEQQLEPLSEHVEVPRYKSYLEAESVSAMARHFGVPETDLAALAAKLPEWHEAEGGVDNGRLFTWSTANPDSKFDWFERGGRFKGFLRLKVAVQPSGFWRLLGARAKDRVDHARKKDIDAAPLLAEPPAAVFVDSVWHECPITSDPAELERWRLRFAELFGSIGDESLLTVMDMHS